MRGVCPEIAVKRGVATWKDIPQDAHSMVTWKRRRGQIATTNIYDGTLSLDLGATRTLIADLEIGYIVTVREFGRLEWDLPLVYRNGSFEIFRCAKPAASSPN